MKKVMRVDPVFAVVLLIGSAWAQQPQAPAAAPSPAVAASPKDSSPTPAPPSAPAAKVTVQGVDPMTGIPLYKTIRENWSSLSVKGSVLVPEPPLVGEETEGKTFTRTMLALKWRPGDALDVYVVMPKGVKNPPAVLYLYGYPDDTERFRSESWCERVTSGGVAAVGFVSALTGQRFHDRPLKQWFVSELQESLGSTVHDVKFILDYLDSRGDIDMSRIGMFGQGSGGAIAILAAAADHRIKAIDLLDPWGDWPVWLAKSPVIPDDDPDKADYSKKEFLKKVAPLDPVKWLPTLKTTKIRMQQMGDNDAVPREVQDRLKAVAPKQAFVDRFNTIKQLTDVEGGGILFGWIKGAVLKMPSLAAPVAPGKRLVADKAATKP
jgi:hypothetical protein